MIPESQVIGRAFAIAWPPSRWRILPVPPTFEQPGVVLPAGPAAGQSQAAGGLAVAQGATVRPGGPHLPLTAGFAGAIPLTWLQRRVRRRTGGPGLEGRGNGS